MSDQATLSSFEDSISLMNATNTTTPPIGGQSGDSKNFHSGSGNHANDLSSVLGSLSLDNGNALFANKIPSTPPAAQWGNNWGFNSLMTNPSGINSTANTVVGHNGGHAHANSDSVSSTNSHERLPSYPPTTTTNISQPFATSSPYAMFDTFTTPNSELLNRSPPPANNLFNDIMSPNSFLPVSLNSLNSTNNHFNLNNYQQTAASQQRYIPPTVAHNGPAVVSVGGNSNNAVPTNATSQQQLPLQYSPPQNIEKRAQNNGTSSSNNGNRNSTSNVHRKHSNNNHRRGEDASKFMNAKLEDFINEIYYLCKDQHGCRFLQRQLEVRGEEASTAIFKEIQLNVIELMIDPFGNYLIQKLLQRVSQEQRLILVKNASPQFVRIALDPHGTRALQKLIECIQLKEEFEIVVESLRAYVVLLSRDLNGNHVIQKCLQKLPNEYCEFIFESACENCIKIAKHRHGCCVLQRCFDNGDAVQCEKLAQEVGLNCTELSTDPYGNYVVQYVLTMEETRLKNQPNDQISQAIKLILESLKNNLVKLSTHKFGSNVIEKSLRIPSLAPTLTNELIGTNLKLLINDAYGNYVLQTGLDVADDVTFEKLSEVLKPFLNDVRNTPHGRRIVSKLISRGGVSRI